YTESDLSSRSGILRLLTLAIASAGQPIREVHFAAKEGPSYVTARPSIIRRTVQQFLAVKQSSGPRAQPQPRNKKERRRYRRAANIAAIGSLGRAQALQAINLGVKVFPVWYPTRS